MFLNIYWYFLVIYNMIKINKILTVKKKTKQLGNVRKDLIRKTYKLHTLTLEINSQNTRQGLSKYNPCT